MLWTWFVGLGALLAALSVALGAFSAHLLKGALGEYEMNILETAARYQMYHAIGMILSGLILLRIDTWMTRTAGFMFLFGVLIFSGSLLGIALLQHRWLGAITPIGGSFLILGWLLLSAALLLPKG